MLDLPPPSFSLCGAPVFASSFVHIGKWGRFIVCGSRALCTSADVVGSHQEPLSGDRRSFLLGVSFMFGGRRRLGCRDDEKAGACRGVVE